MSGSRTAEHQLLLMMPLLRSRKVSVTTSYSLARMPYGLGIWFWAVKKMRSIMMNLLYCTRARSTVTHACLRALGWRTCAWAAPQIKQGAAGCQMDVTRPACLVMKQDAAGCQVDVNRPVCSVHSARTSTDWLHMVWCAPC